jgi:phosphatidylglycerophosphate synthase
MLDRILYRLIDLPLGLVARLVPSRVTADALSLAGFVVGLAAIPTIAVHHYWVGLGMFLANRFLDGLDGAVARRQGATTMGAYLDRLFDFVVYAGLPFGFALADPSRAVSASFLLFAFVASGTALLAAHQADERAGVAEAAATTIAFGAACIFPDWFSLIAYGFGMLCFVSAGLRAAAVLASAQE